MSNVTTDELAVMVADRLQQQIDKRFRDDRRMHWVSMLAVFITVVVLIVLAA